MNRLQQLFQEKKENLLSIYFTAGFPELHQTVDIAKQLEQAGVDFLEIGFPYSDPVADGTVIQESSQKALQNGMHLHLLFEQLKTLRNHVQIPILLMGYVNPVLQYGVENFCKSCAACGIDGTIIPDLPMNEYEQFYARYFEENHLSNIFLVTPQTSEARIRKIDSLSNAFIYLLSSAATTGKTLDLGDVTEQYFSRMKAMQLQNPLMVGFGISNHEGFQKACNYTSGAIVGSAFVKLLGQNPSDKEIGTFIHQIKFGR